MPRGVTLANAVLFALLLVSSAAGCRKCSSSSSSSLEVASDPVARYSIRLPPNAGVTGSRSTNPQNTIIFKNWECPAPAADGAAQFLEIEVIVGAAAKPQSLDEAARASVRFRGESVSEKRTLGADDYEIVMSGPRESRVHVYRGDKQRPGQATCGGPAASLGLLREICESFRLE